MMSLQRVVAAPFKQSGSTELTEQALVVGLSLHRDWFSPDQAKQVIKRGRSEGLLAEEGDGFSPTFDPADVRIPRDFRPDQGILTTRTPFERTVDAIVSAGTEKRDAVAGINRVQRDLDVTIEAAAAIFAAANGVEIPEEIGLAASELDRQSR